MNLTKCSQPSECTSIPSFGISLMLCEPHKQTIVVGVRAWLARSYFIPGGTSQKGGWSGPGVPCRTLSDLERGQEHYTSATPTREEMSVDEHFKVH